MKGSALFTFSLLLFASLPSFATTAYVDGKSTIRGIDYAGQEGNRIPHRTNFSFADDGTALVVEFDVDYPMENLDEERGRKRSVWQSDDNLEIWLDPSGEGKQVMQFVIDPFGRRWDRRSPKSDASEFSWTSTVTRGKKGWKATVRFPYADFGLKPAKKGDRWMCNVCRSYRAEKGGARTLATWAAVGANFNNPGKFNDLLFGSAEEVAEVFRQRRITETAALRKELAAKGYADRFAFKLGRLEAGATDVLIQEIRDEVKLLDAMKGIRK